MMKSACYSILALVFCLAENIVLAKPKTPDYSNMTATTESESKGPVDFGQAYRGILNKVPCNVGNIIDAMVNVNIPATKQEMENNGEFYQVAESESIFHNFREGVLSATSSRDLVQWGEL